MPADERLGLTLEMYYSQLLARAGRLRELVSDSAQSDPQLTFPDSRSSIADHLRCQLATYVKSDPLTFRLTLYHTADRRFGRRQDPS